MPTARDIAQYILEKRGKTATIQLQKLVYYCQAWHLVWEDTPLFDDHVEAWANGPVIPNLFSAHKGHFSIDASFSIGDSSSLAQNEKESIDAVIAEYGKESSQHLVELTHLEDPWKEARRNCRPGERCNNVISLAAMADYYSGL